MLLTATPNLWAQWAPPSPPAPAPRKGSAPPAEEAEAPEPVEVPITPLDKLGDSAWRDVLGIVRESDDPVGSGDPCAAQDAVASCLELAQSITTGACAQVEELISCWADAGGEVGADAATIAELREMAASAGSAEEGLCSLAMDRLASQLAGVTACAPETTAALGTDASEVSTTSGDGPLGDVPAIGNTDMTRFRLAAMAGVALYQPAGNELIGPAITGLIGYDFRESTSLVAPWIEAMLVAGPSFGDGTSADVNNAAASLNLMGYVGVDFHPRRWKFLSVGPYIGAGPAVYANDDDAADFRVDWLGSRLRFRTMDEDVDTLPLIEVDYKLFLRGSSAVVGAPHMGLSGSIGDDLRLITYVDVRLSEPGQAEIASAVSERVRAGIGAAWF